MPWLLAGPRPYAWLILLCLALHLPGLFTLPPMDRDEARFVQATRQMLETDDYVRINFQEQSRTKKPVGIHWLQAGSVSAFSEAAATTLWPYRLPSVLGVTLAVLATFAFGRTLAGTRGAMAGAVFLAISTIAVAEANLAKTDAVLLACTVIALGALSRVYLSGAGVVRTGLFAPLLFWLAFGAGILIKGPIVPMVAIATALALCIWDRRAGWLLRLRPISGLILVIAMVAPWLIAVSEATEGGFVGKAVSEDLIPKLLGGHESHGAPPGFHLLVLPLTFFPAFLLLIPGLIRGWRERTQPGMRFLLAWLVPSWIIFELVPTKLPHYTLPLLPAAALLAGAAVMAVRDPHQPLFRGRAAKVGYVIFLIVVIAIAGAIAALPFAYGGAIDPLSILAALAVAALGAFAFTRAWRGRTVIAAALLVPLSVLAHGVVLEFTRTRIDEIWVSPRLAAAVARHVEPGAPPPAVAGFHEPSLVFLLGTDTRLLEGAGVADSALRSGRLALVEERQRPAFEQALAQLGGVATALETVTGRNYSNGRKVAITLYRVSPGGGGVPAHQPAQQTGDRG